MKMTSLFLTAFLALSCAGNTKKASETSNSESKTTEAMTEKTSSSENTPANCIHEDSEAAEMNMKGCVKTMVRKDLYYYGTSDEPSETSTTELKFNEKGFLLERIYTGSKPQFNRTEITTMATPIQKKSFEWKQNGVLKNQATFAYNASGNLVLKETILFRDDGSQSSSKREYTYNDAGKVAMRRELQDGTINGETVKDREILRAEFSYPSGNTVVEKIYRDDALAETKTRTNNDNGAALKIESENVIINRTTVSEMKYDAEGNLIEVKSDYGTETYTYVYDEKGNYTRLEQYEDGKLRRVSEASYVYFE